MDQIPIAAKTGTAEVGTGSQRRSWFASYAPANKPQYAVVMMVSQGGTGSGVSGPSVEKIYEALYGVTSPTTVDPKKALMTGAADQAAEDQHGGTPDPRADTPILAGVEP